VRSTGEKLRQALCPRNASPLLVELASAAYVMLLTGSARIIARYSA